MSTAISTRVMESVELFNFLTKESTTALYNVLEFEQIKSLEGECGRFIRWSKNIGAHKVGTSSLEYRLRDASQIRAQVIRLLDHIKRLLQDAVGITVGEKIPWDQLDDDESSSDEEEMPNEFPSSEMDQIIQHTADTVQNLLHLSVSMRNPAPHKRFIACQSIDTSHYEPYDTRHVRAKFPTADPELTQRLGKAISVRRQYFKYRENHNAKLASGLDGEGATDGSTVASSLPKHLKDKAGNGESSLAFEENSSDLGSQTSYATSVRGEGKLSVPPLLKEAEEGHPFECPYCYMMIVVSSHHVWKKHVYSDLQPYVCLENDCAMPNRQYGRRKQWFDHVLQEHWTEYRCPSGCGSAFRTARSCSQHYRNQHPGQQTLVEIDTLVQLHSSNRDVSSGIPCPLCHERFLSTKEYKRHVGRHQEELALFALPGLDLEEEHLPDSNEEDQAKPESNSTGESNDSVVRIQDSVQDMEDIQDIPANGETQRVESWACHLCGQGAMIVSYAPLLQRYR
ncbi:hypothetical protein FDECE_11821 [Fusarium decemcellulare]|nr:hypothetical protein FDECE_11821 [Fusarium decemcellulare]